MFGRRGSVESIRCPFYVQAAGIGSGFKLLEEAF